MTVSIEHSIVSAIQPVRFYLLALCLYELFESGLYDTLAENSGASCTELTEIGDFVPERLQSLLTYLKYESVVEEEAGGIALTELGRNVGQYRAWYTMFIGGYTETVQQLPRMLVRGDQWASRNGAKVGEGSCGISHYDAIPLILRLVGQVPHGVGTLLDLGCGNAACLVELCRLLPGSAGVGVEPDVRASCAARDLINREGLGDRIRIVCDSADRFVTSSAYRQCDVVVLSFVLHEMLAQGGAVAVETFLRTLVERAPGVHVAVIEVDPRWDTAEVMGQGLGLAYYNPYFLMHALTQQELKEPSFWEALFHRAGLQLLAKEFVDASVDSTGLEVGFLVRQR